MTPRSSAAVTICRAESTTWSRACSSVNGAALPGAPPVCSGDALMTTKPIPNTSDAVSAESINACARDIRSHRTFPPLMTANLRGCCWCVGSWRIAGSTVERRGTPSPAAWRARCSVVARNRAASRPRSNAAQNRLHRYLPPPRAVGKRPDVHFILAGLVRCVRDPLPVRRQLPLALDSVRRQELHRLAQVRFARPTANTRCPPLSWDR